MKACLCLSEAILVPHYANDHERASEVTLFLMAGHDTTSFTAAWTLYELARVRRGRTFCIAATPATKASPMPCGRSWTL